MIVLGFSILYGLGGNQRKNSTRPDSSPAAMMSAGITARQVIAASPTKRARVHVSNHLMIIDLLLFDRKACA